jgi:hypothetical protein
MAGERKAAEKYIIDNLEKIMPDGTNRKIYEQLFASMSDVQFDNYMKKLNDGSAQLSIIAPNFSKTRLSMERNFALAKELKHNFFEKIWMTDGDDTPPYLSPIPYLVVDLPLRRQAQLLIKKISIPEDNKSVDDLTGQPTGKSKGSKISYPEIQILAACGLEDSLVELLKARGGDNDMFNNMNNAISRTGAVSIKAIDNGNTTVTSTETLKTLLTSAHLSNTL